MDFVEEMEYLSLMSFVFIIDLGSLFDVHFPEHAWSKRGTTFSKQSMLGPQEGQHLVNKINHMVIACI
jgi:hypothetical protein